MIDRKKPFVKCLILRKKDDNFKNKSFESLKKSTF